MRILNFSTIPSFTPCQSSTWLGVCVLAQWVAVAVRCYIPQCSPDMFECFLPTFFGLQACKNLVFGNSKIFVIFTNTWGNDPIWRAYFSDGWFNQQLEMPTVFGVKQTKIVGVFFFQRATSGASEQLRIFHDASTWTRSWLSSSNRSRAARTTWANRANCATLCCQASMFFRIPTKPEKKPFLKKIRCWWICRFFLFISAAFSWETLSFDSYIKKILAFARGHTPVACSEIHNRQRDNWTRPLCEPPSLGRCRGVHFLHPPGVQLRYTDSVDPVSLENTTFGAIMYIDNTRVYNTYRYIDIWWYTCLSPGSYLDKKP